MSTNCQFVPRSIPENEAALVKLSRGWLKINSPKPTRQEEITDAYTLIVECDRQERRNRLGGSLLLTLLSQTQSFALRTDVRFRAVDDDRLDDKWL